jgi:Protein of unknown function (DUF3570)
MRLQLVGRSAKRGRGQARRLLVLALICAGAASSHAAPVRSSAAPQAKKNGAQALADGSEGAHGPTWKISAEFSGYADSDAVYVAAPTLSVGAGDELAGWSVNGRYLVDAVSAASVDVVTSASGRWIEYRHVGALAAEVPVGGAKLAVSGGISREPDYLSIGGGGTMSVELLEKNFVPYLGVSLSRDQVGRTGEPDEFWRLMERVGVQIGATFVVGRSTIAGISVDGISERGYLGKPYRYVPLFAPGASAALAPGASPGEVNRARLDQRPADAVPDARDRLAVTGRLAHRLDGSTLRLDERLYMDGWGLWASTTDLRLMVDLGRRVIAWPHLRVHAQKGVDFWRRSYEASAAPDGSLGPPRFRTGDRELGPMATLTAGAGLRWRVSREGAAPTTLFLHVDGAYTRFFDALYITRRYGLFTAIGIETDLD